MLQTIHRKRVHISMEINIFSNCIYINFVIRLFNYSLLISLHNLLLRLSLRLRLRQCWLLRLLLNLNMGVLGFGSYTFLLILSNIFFLTNYFICVNMSTWLLNRLIFNLLLLLNLVDYSLLIKLNFVSKWFFFL